MTFTFIFYFKYQKEKQREILYKPARFFNGVNAHLKSRLKVSCPVKHALQATVRVHIHHSSESVLVKLLGRRAKQSLQGKAW